MRPEVTYNISQRKHNINTMYTNVYFVNIIIKLVKTINKSNTYHNKLARNKLIKMYENVNGRK
jgi:hypothetical protein